MIVCLVVGVGVTLVAAISPARRAVRIAPVAAVSERADRSRDPTAAPLHPGRVITAVGIALLAVGLTKPAIAAGRPRCRPDLRRRRHAGTGGGAPHGERHWAPARPPARHLGPAGPGELHAQPPAHRPDGGGAHGRPGAGVGDRGVRRLAVELGHEQRRQRHQRQPHHQSPAARQGTATSATPCRSAAAAVPGVTATSTVYQDQFELQRVPRELSSAVGTQQPDPDGDPQHGPRARRPRWPPGQLLVDTTTANYDHLSVGELVPVQFAMTGRSTMRIGGIYQAERTDREVPRRRRLLPRPLRQPPARRGALEDRRQPGGAVGGQAGAGRLPESAGPDPGPVRARHSGT